MDFVNLSSVFVPGRYPRFTYNPRRSLQLEERLGDLVEDGGAIICISGLTKMGKTVLANTTYPPEKHVWVKGGEFNTFEEFWKKVGDELVIYPNVSLSSTSADSFNSAATGEVGFPGVGKIGGQLTYGDTQTHQALHGVERPTSSAALEALKKSGKILVVDDFHFVPREVQRLIIRSIKGALFEGLRVITISTSHRVLDVITAEPNMDGRAEPIDIALWTKGELENIADMGFTKLNLRDRSRVIASNLANNSFGSPHLMQTFCRQICRDNGHRRTAAVLQDLRPPEDWSHFFSKQARGASESWFNRLLRGPQERGKARKEWPRKAGGTADNYALIMEAMTQATVEAVSNNQNPFVISKDRIKYLVDEIVDGPGPTADKTTRALRGISEIAARPLGSDTPSAEEVYYNTQNDIHYVLEYIDQGPNSRIYITDPFFLYYLRWGAPSKFNLVSQ